MSAPQIGGLRFIAPLGSGGYADVYLYEQEMPRRKVAVKVLKLAHLDDELRRQFTDEANAMAELADHPNIVPVFSADVSTDGRPFLVMMYYPRPNLGARAAAERFAVAEVLRIGIQISSAVETAHRAGILHRDIKPANILTSQYGTPGLTDFGIAARAAAVADDADTGVSVPWSPPEVLYATASASPQSDVYSLGATVWHLLVGRSPFEVPGGDNGQYALMRRVRDAPPPPTQRPDVPPALDRLLRQSMAKGPSARPVSALEFARSLQAVEQEERLPRTEIVVTSDESATPRSAAIDVDEDATRMRAPVRVEAQRDPRGSGNVDSRAGAKAPDSTRTRAKPVVALPAPARAKEPAALLERPAASTVRRQAVTAPPATEAMATQKESGNAAPGRRGTRLPVAVAIGVAAIIAAVVTGVVLSSAGGKSHAGSPPATGVDTNQDPNNPNDVPAPAAPVVTVSTVRANLVLAWTPTGTRPGDSYQWIEVAGATTPASATLHRTSATSATIPNLGGVHGRCFEVRVVRIGVSGPVAWSDKKCAQ